MGLFSKNTPHTTENATNDCNFLNQSDYHVGTGSDAYGFYQLSIGQRLYAYNSTYNFFSSLFDGAINRLANLDDKFKNSMYDPMQSNIEARLKGLKHIIIDGLIQGNPKYYRIETQANTIFYIPINIEHKQKELKPDEIVIDYSNSIGRIVYSLYCQYYTILRQQNNAFNYGNKPYLKLPELYQRVGAKEVGQLKSKQINALANAFKADTMPFIDADGAIEMLSIDSDLYTKNFENIYTHLAHVSGMPLSFVTGVNSGGLNTTGEGDRRQRIEGYLNFYSNNLYKIFYEVNYRISGKYDVITAKDIVEYKFLLNSIKDFPEEAQTKIYNTIITNIERGL